MTFAKASRGREVAYITQLLSIFGVVEVRQMRKLFSHLPDRQYGQLMSRLRREGLVFYEAEGRYLSTSRFALEKARVPDAVRTFWVLIRLRDKVADFCAGEEPALLSFASARADYDLIPVRPENLDAIREGADRIPPQVKRLLIVPDREAARGLEYRMKNDYVAAVTGDGEVALYKM